MLIGELLTYLFDGGPHLLAEPVGTWLNSSRRFAAFVDTFRDKIRKKIRVTQDPETILDIRLELETAYLLLQEKTLSLVYEPQLAEKVRSPDFAVSYTTSLTFMLEVTRLRINPKSTDDVANNIGDRLADAICSKLGQLIHQQGNIVLVGMDALSLTQDEVRAAMLRMQQRAERSDQTFFQRYHFRDRAEFFRYYGRLSEILVRGTDRNSFIAWVNPQAKSPLPSKIRTVIYRSQIAQTIND
ncbi:MAG: hypothetical protein QM730_05745 [Anaerolineales bacterium]